MDNQTTPNEEKGAFPCINEDYLQEGLTKREYIATHILAGLRANTDRVPYSENLARVAIEQTDELLKQLNQ